MLYVIFGTREKTVARTQELLKKTDAQTMSADTMDYTVLDSYLSGGGLFGNNHGVCLDGLYTSDEHHEALVERLPIMASSDTVVILREESIKAPHRKKAEKHGAVVEDFSEKKAKKKNTELFAITDAYIAGNVKNMWVSYHVALRAGFAPEEIHGVLWWNIKNLLLVLQSATNPGLHNFVYQKLSRCNRSVEDVRADAHRLMEVLYEARSGAVDLVDGLESWLTQSRTVRKV